MGATDMNDIDNQIAEKIIKAVQDASGWQWIKHDFGSNGWMRKGKLMVKAFEHMSPREAWNYICFKINDEEWEIPYEMRGKMWRACYPLFEKVRELAEYQAKHRFLNSF